jgi:Ethanolamine utilization protein EutJ (predicted chaperonin)
MTINFHENISLVRLAGINRFVVVEFKGGTTCISLINNDEPLYKINSLTGLEKYSVVVSDNDSDMFERILSKFSNDNGLENNNNSKTNNGLVETGYKN